MTLPHDTPKPESLRERAQHINREDDPVLRSHR
jgi:hypothetical protein